MKRKDTPQLFELMRTKLSGKLQAPPSKMQASPAGSKETHSESEDPDAPPPAAPPAAPAELSRLSVPRPEPARTAFDPAQTYEPSPVSPPLILPPAEAPAERGPVTDAPVEAGTTAPEAPSGMPAVATTPPPPREPVFQIEPPKPKPHPQPRPFVIRPPSPSLLESSPEQRIVLPYPWALATTAALFVLIFLAFALGRAGASSRGGAATLSRREGPHPDAAGSPRARPWTLNLTACEAENSDRAKLDQMRARLWERHRIRTRIREWTSEGARSVGLFAEARWPFAEAPDLLRLRETLREMDVLGDGHFYFSDCRAVQEP